MKNHFKGKSLSKRTIAIALAAVSF